jgi:hypothetical protein
VFAKRWAALVAVVALVVIVLVVALRSRPPSLYWQGEPIGNSQQVLAEAQRAMTAIVADNEGAVSSQSRCYFSLPNSAAHDVAAYLRCGPVLFPWSSSSAPWLTDRLSARMTGTSEQLSVEASPSAATSRLARGEVLRRPDGTAPPNGDGGLAVPAVPRQGAGWGGVLSAPPFGLQPAPAADLIGDWGQSYRLVAFGTVDRLSARLDEAALRSAYDPPGSAWSTGAGSKPRAELLLPARGQELVVAELAVSPGEEDGAVPAQANGKGLPTTDTPSVEVLAGATATVLATSGAAGRANLTIAASVPSGSKPVLQISDKGLVQQVSLSTGRLGASPAVLSRAGTDEPLSVSGALEGVSVQVSDAALVWFAGSDGGTVPPQPDEAYLQVLASATPADAMLPTSDFTLEMPGGEVIDAQALPDSDRQAVVVGFVVPASFSNGTVVVSAGGRSLRVPVHFP